jgi:hypothetical protein
VSSAPESSAASTSMLYMNPSEWKCCWIAITLS